MQFSLLLWIRAVMHVNFQITNLFYQKYPNFKIAQFTYFSSKLNSEKCLRVINGIYFKIKKMKSDWLSVLIDISLQKRNVSEKKQYKIKVLYYYYKAVLAQIQL